MRDPIHANPTLPAICCWIATLAVAAAAASAAADASPGVPLTIEDGSITFTRAVERVTPDFPGKARRKGVSQARVVVQTIIDKEGRVIDPVVLNCDRPRLGFERAALKVVRKWRFEPALQDGQAVDVYFFITIDFSLHPAGGRPDRNQ